METEDDLPEPTHSHLPIPPTGHESVLPAEIIGLFDPLEGKTAVDCTVGRGGHSSLLAERLGAKGTLIGLDVDPRNLEYAKERLAGAPCTVRLFHANFSELDDVLEEVGIESVDRILADLGVSTNQLFDGRYGMSFAQDMPLDMRLDPRIRQTAADLVNRMKEDDLANAIYQYADERYSRRIARKIGEERRLSPITTTARLADVVRSAIPKRGGAPEKIDPATRTFLALRIMVNQETDKLHALLKTAPRALSPGGRFAVISFQSTEDRIVKQAFRVLEQVGSHRVLTKKPVVPTDEEASRNPRSRSSKLRVIERA